MIEKDAVTPTRFVGAILAAVYEKNKNKLDLPADKLKLHSIFFKVGQTNKDLFAILEFDTRTACPYSPALDNAMANIQASNALRRENPPMTKLVVKENILGYKKRIEETLKYDLNPIADEFSRTLEKV